MKGEDLTVLEQTTQLTHTHSYYWLPSQSHWKNLPWRLNLLNGSCLYYKTIPCGKNSAFCSVLQGNPAVASPKERLYEQMTSNPTFTERNIQKPNAYLLDSRPQQKSLVTYHTLRSLLRMCLACQHFDFNSADWISDKSACDLQMIFSNNGKGIYLWVQLWLKQVNRLLSITGVTWC